MRPGHSAAEDAASAFAQHATDYDALRRRLVPCFDAFYSAATEVLEAGEGAIMRVLDLGAGTGLFTERVLGLYAGAHVVLLDAAEEMLRQAVERLEPASIEIRCQDLREELPAGSFDAVVSALAIHHLEDDAKRDLLTRAHTTLRPGGVFVNADQVAAPTPWLTDVYDRVWRRQCQMLGATDAELAAADARMSFDRCADATTQLGWMRQAGFEHVDCFFKASRFAVMAGWKADAQ